MTPVHEPSRYSPMRCGDLSAGSSEICNVFVATACVTLQQDLGASSHLQFRTVHLDRPISSPLFHDRRREGPGFARASQDPPVA